MKVMLDYPPAFTGDTREQLQALTSWLTAACDTLNAALASLGCENFNSATREMLSGKETK